jgi:hypothetical protein
VVEQSPHDCKFKGLILSNLALRDKVARKKA